jgi:hypothetical protein
MTTLLMGMILGGVLTSTMMMKNVHYRLQIRHSEGSDHSCDRCLVLVVRYQGKQHRDLTDLLGMTSVVLIYTNVDSNLSLSTSHPCDRCLVLVVRWQGKQHRDLTDLLEGLFKGVSAYERAKIHVSGQGLTAILDTDSSTRRLQCNDHKNYDVSCNRLRRDKLCESAPLRDNKRQTHYPPITPLNIPNPFHRQLPSGPVPDAKGRSKGTSTASSSKLPPAQPPASKPRHRPKAPSAPPATGIRRVMGDDGGDGKDVVGLP